MVFRSQNGSRGLALCWEQFRGNAISNTIESHQGRDFKISLTLQCFLFLVYVCIKVCFFFLMQELKCSSNISKLYKLPLSFLRMLVPWLSGGYVGLIWNKFREKSFWHLFIACLFLAFLGWSHVSNTGNSLCIGKAVLLLSYYTCS